MPYGGGYSGLSSKNNKLNRYDFIKNSKKGAILIEFAFAVPVLFSLIYYINDLATIKRWHSKLDFSLHCAANMFQNTQNIKKIDFARIAYAGVMGMFGDPEHSIRPAGYTEAPIIILALCITGTGNNRCKVNWAAYSNANANEIQFDSQINGTPTRSSRFGGTLKNINVGSTYNATDLDSSLKIERQETKIILEISVYKGRCVKDYDRDYFKLFLAKVSEVFSMDRCPVLMNHYIIFTPKPGTFDPNNPPQ